MACIRRRTSRSTTAAFGAFSRARDGAVAIEFAFVVPVLMLMALWTFEFALLMIQQQAVDYAASAASRALRTGAAQNSPDPEEFVRDEACRAGFGWIRCTQLDLDVRTWPDFETADPPPLAFDPETGRATSLTFQPGGPGEIMTVRVAYAYSGATPLSYLAVNRALTAGSVVRGEPWR